MKVRKKLFKYTKTYIDYEKKNLEESEPLEYSEKLILERCANLTLKPTSECITNQIEGFYNYNISNKGVHTEEMNFSRLMSEGGVCVHYNNFLEKWGEELGFYTKHVTLLPEVTHGFSVIYGTEDNLSEYCTLDQKRVVGCFNSR